MRTKKLIVVSSRLPVHLERFPEGWTATASPGGLATALRALAAERPFTWVGWPGTAVEAADQPAVAAALGRHWDAKPVFVEPEEYAGYYEGIANRVLWPLFHSLPTGSSFDEPAWAAYQAVNERFAERVAAVAQPGDAIWVHDYQLALVPELLRRRDLGCAIGFFLHIPFPSPETYRTLPVREAVLRGMLGADLVGFHAYDYASHFRGACLRVLGLASQPEAIELPSHFATVAVLPIGIDPEELEQLACAPTAVRLHHELSQRYRGCKVVLGVDRLDYTKGLPQKLLAFEELLRVRPDWRERVVCVQVAAPSRTGVPEYQALKREMDELVGRINGEYGTLTWTPVVYLNRTVPRERLVSLYRLADVALLTPVRDGMNLVALEYLAARGEDPGALVLSEFTGAAAFLAGAHRVNPHNTTETAAILAEVLDRETPDVEAFRQMQRFVRRNTATFWAGRFLERLEEAWEAGSRHTVDLDAGAGRLAGFLAEARQVLFLLDYDGTLVAHTSPPSRAVPDQALRGLLRGLAKCAPVWIVSGRPANALDAWLGDLGVGLVCEHGLALRPPGGSWEDAVEIDPDPLFERVAPILEDFRSRVPGSLIERKRASIAWHYRDAEPNLAIWQARELWSVLEDRLAAQPYAILKGARVIEVRPVETSKGGAALTLMARYPEADLVVCAGDDRTDEEMFDAVLQSGHPRAVVCHVGDGPTRAPLTAANPAALRRQLERMAERLRAR